MKTARPPPYLLRLIILCSCCGVISHVGGFSELAKIAFVLANEPGNLFTLELGSNEPSKLLILVLKRQEGKGEYN
jgi:hypothetical protein